MTDYMTTRWYRAPEIILCQRIYDGKVDVWSIGCILAEMITRKPLMPAKSEKEQMAQINDLIGNADPKLVAKIEDRENREYMQALPKRKGQDLNQLLKKASPDCIDLIRKMLTFDPN